MDAEDITVDLLTSFSLQTFIFLFIIKLLLCIELLSPIQMNIVVEPRREGNFSEGKYWNRLNSDWPFVPVPKEDWNNSLGPREDRIEPFVESSSVFSRGGTRVSAANNPRQETICAPV